MKKLLPIALLLLSCTVALADDSKTYDFTPIVNQLIGIAATVLAGSAATISLLLINFVRKKMNLAALQMDAELQKKLDDLAQKSIGGAIAKQQLDPNTLKINIDNDLVRAAAQRLADTASQTLTRLGSKDNLEAATKIIENRIGMLLAVQANTPIPGPTQVSKPTDGTTTTTNP